MSGELLVNNCSPTMAGLKTANLFICTFPSRQAVYDELERLNSVFVPKGLCLICLKYHDKRAFLYLFRPSLLRRDMTNAASRRILEGLNYPVGDCASCLHMLMSRLQSCEGFPHEIGLFLGYPPEDVDGFIRLGPKKAKACGYWQVYGDVDAANAVFSKYRRCTQVYTAAYLKHGDLSRLIVAA